MMNEEINIRIDGESHQLTKLYYSIGEVAKLFNVATSLLRFWEGEFKALRPGKNKNGERKYTKKDILLIESIYELVKVRGFTLDGAKLELQKSKDSERVQLDDLKNRLLKLKMELQNHIGNKDTQ